MTLIGAIECAGGVVLLADRQETISDYAKWDCCKITQWELANTYRFFLSGAGISDSIEMVKDRIREKWGGQFTALPAVTEVSEIRKMIIDTVREVTLQAQLEGQAEIDLIWAVQKIQFPGPKIEIFHTHGLLVNNIRRHYFGGSPMLLTKFLSDMYLERILVGTEEAEALAAYFLWEAKEYDPSVGKHSDIITLLHDGTHRRMSRAVEEYWEKHFYELKRAMCILPLLSCSTALSEHIYNRNEHMERFNRTLEVLAEGQREMRANPPTEHPLTLKINEEQRKVAQKHMELRRENTPITLSNFQTSEDQQ
jgi:hypothetical protein